jgi:protein MBA1
MRQMASKNAILTRYVPMAVTFVPLPFSQYPRSPSDFFAYTWIRLKAWITSTVSVLQAKLQSQEKWTSRPRWKARRGRIAPTAKAMYRDMLEAFAAGDKETLNRLCTPHFAGKLLAAIDRRPRNERVHFELVRYNKPLFYPRLSSYLIGLFNPLDKYSLREQAIVAIASTQAMSRIHSNQQEKEISKTLKTQDKVEYVVLVRDVDSRTWQSTSWQIWGTTTFTTLQQSRDHQAAMIQQQTKAAGWKQPSGSS